MFEQYPGPSHTQRRGTYDGMHVSNGFINFSSKTLHRMKDKAGWYQNTRINLYYDKINGVIKIAIGDAYKLGASIGIRINAVMPKGRYLYFEEKDDAWYFQKEK